MSTVFNNFGSTIGNQVNGTLNIGPTKDNEIAFIHLQLDTLLRRLNDDAATSKADIQKALKAIEEINLELDHKSPNAVTIERSLSAIGSISSIASLIDQIRPFLKNLL